MSHGTLIVGFGAAGLSAAEALRRSGYSGALTILSGENHRPYDRPPLSKGYLTGSIPAVRLELATESRIAALDATIKYGTKAVALDTQIRTVTDSQGVHHPYNNLVIATGVRPRLLPDQSLRGVHVLRDLADAEGLRDQLRPGRRVTVIGGGFLGLEVAATATKLGAHCTVVEPTPLPLAERVGEHTAQRLLALHTAHGVRILTATSAARVVGRNEVVGTAHTGDDDQDGDEVTRVLLTDGSVVETDVVVVAIGSTPNTEWLENSGVVVDNGVVCDSTCRAGESEWAVGDVARWHHPEADAPLRLEHRMNANEQAAHVARGILGSKEGFNPVPFFWTDQFDTKIQFAGFKPASASAEIVGDSPGNNSFVVVWREDGQVTGVLGWNATRELMPYRRELATRYRESATAEVA
ncbi:NAD(P)/FAD-dependent oxidoreductase [Rhodococcus koreensis]